MSARHLRQLGFADGDLLIGADGVLRLTLPWIDDASERQRMIDDLAEAIERGELF